MDISQLSSMFPGWTAVDVAGQCAFGPIYSLEQQKNGSTKHTSALVIPVPDSPQSLRHMRASGMDELQIMLKLQSEVDAIIDKCRSHGIPGLLRCEDYSHLRHTADLGWDVVIRTEPVVPLSTRTDLLTSEASIRQFAESAAQTLDACQKKGICVGDLTPDRIFVTPGNEFRLTDLCSVSSGTTDAMSLGLLLYWLLSGRQGKIPTAGSPLAELPGVSPAFGALVLNAARGTEGCTTAAALLHELKKLAPIDPVPPKKRPLLPLILVLAAAAALLLILLRSCGSEPVPTTDPTASIATEPTIPMGWSNWVDTIPDAVTTAEYLVQEQPLYRVQVLENTSSITDTELEGWTFVETVDERGDFLEWSEWADTAPEENPDREIETALRYRTKTKETTTASSKTKDGWTLYDTTSERTNQGNWGSWGSEKLSTTETRDVESKNQYRYREKEYTTSSKSSMDGWDQYDVKHQYGEWGSWSDWSDKTANESDTREVKTRQVEVPGETRYFYGAYFSNNSPNASPTLSHPCGECAAIVYGGDWYYKTTSTTNRVSARTYRHSCRHRKVNSAYTVNGIVYFYEDVETAPSTYKTQYSYRTRSKDTTYYYSRWGSWSDWSDSKPSSTDGRDIQDRTVYRSRSCETIYTYHFYRWTDWTDWGETSATSNSTTEVETKNVYRYHDREIIPTHYFVRWSDWSDYTTAYAVPSETQHVDSKLQLRYIRRDQAEAPPAEWTFTDVAADDPNRASIQWVIDRGITRGTSGTTFSPGDPFTRRQMAIMLWRALDYPEPMNKKMTLSDVTNADPYRNAIYWAVESGIMDVVAPGTFGTDAMATRGDLILSLYRTVGTPDVLLAQEPFSDVEPDMPVYKAVLWSYERGISQGLTTTEFGTVQPCTRLQAAVMLHRSLDQPTEPEASAEPQTPAETQPPTE
jgi:hypothetical protein